MVELSKNTSTTKSYHPKLDYNLGKGDKSKLSAFEESAVQMFLFSPKSVQKNLNLPSPIRTTLK